MRLIDSYAHLVNELLEKERNKLENINIKKKDKDIEKLVKDYDKQILESYRFIEQYIDTKEFK